LCSRHENTASDQANNGQASKTARQAHSRQHSQNKTLVKQVSKEKTEISNNVTTTGDKPSNGQTSRPLRNGIAVSMSSGMSEELRQANIKQYWEHWEQKRLAEETAKHRIQQEHYHWPRGPQPGFSSPVVK
jgi:hypothetical protein